MAYFSPSNLKISSSPFLQSYRIQGTIRYLKGESSAQVVPCSIYLPFQAKRPKISSDFLIEGTLLIQEQGCSFKPKKETLWRPVKNTWSLVEWRYQAKQRFSHWIASQIEDKKAASFLAALATGDLDDPMLSYEFSRVGLQHILAISGFHFGLLALFLGVFLKKIFSEKIAYITLLSLLTLYFLFLGSSPSILRAWTAISIYILGLLCQRPSSGLNALGVGLLIEMIFTPQAALNLGFQLSFLSTAAILMLLPITTPWASFLLPTRNLDEICELSTLRKLIYLLCVYLRTGIALNLAVHLAVIPVCLFYFHTFPWMSFLYNLFFPTGVGFSMLLLLISSSLYWVIPPLNSLICTLNSHFTAFLLSLSSNLPAILDLQLILPEPSLALLLSLEIALFAWGIQARVAKRESH